MKLLSSLPLGEAAGIAVISILARAVGMVASIWLARSWGAAGLGMVAFVMQCQTPLMRLIPLGLEPILVRRASGLCVDDAMSVFRCYSVLKIMVASLAMCLWLLAFWVVYTWGDARVGLIGIILCPLLLQGAVNWLGASQRLHKVSYNGLLELAAALIISLIVLCFVNSGQSIYEGVAIYVAAVSTAVIMSAFWGRRLVAGWYRRGDCSVFVRNINWSDGRWPLIIGLASYGYTTFDIPIVGLLYGFESAGYYRAAGTLSSAILTVAAAFASIMYPRYVEWAKNVFVLKARLKQLELFSVMMVVCGTIAMLGGGRHFLEITFGLTYGAGYPILLALGFSKLVIIWVNVWSMSLLALHGERYIAILTTGVSLSCMGLNFVVAPVGFGPWVVACLGAVAELIVGFCCRARVMRYIQDND